MADPKGFLKHRDREATTLPARSCPHHGLEGSPYRPGRCGAAPPGRPMHGLRHPVLPPGLPAGQPHPGVERPGAATGNFEKPSNDCTRRTTSQSSRSALPGAV